MKTLTLELRAPLQSYGDEAAFARRTTFDHPTKSAVVGMLGAAMGYARTDSRLLALNRLQFAVRVDQPGVLTTDYQTVEWKAGTRKITYRDYLQDARFVVAVGSDDSALIDALAQALRRPRFALCLGRRADPPAGPLAIEVHQGADPVAVLRTMAWRAAPWFQKRRRRLGFVAELFADAALVPDGRVRLVKDLATATAQVDRRFTFRGEAVLRVPLAEPAPADTAHDALAAIKEE
ncbi:type I-E CRISPR-associated protein Cas5/CasD [Lacticaseibacillus kribbianus]|uniref:type I-E CRISPR-associated protein Cas5/CasD n=1 Tax=Lacticaseibacillus kribbianus TaxID=2926292 RepID=UPI001CD551E5|nr:type I-E CRISPR-associated protein Cas5/CasD [Lacticaseibacillus kribbianus]